MNVLIVDDDPTNLKLFGFMLRAIPDVVPVECADPAEGIAWCGENDPDLVLLDFMMPEMDGLEFLRKFRALPGKAAIPVIMATADTDDELRNEALQLSANDFLTKPVNKVELRARVTNLLTLRRYQRHLASRAEWLAEEVRNATTEILAREHEVIVRLSRAAEYRDPETGAHLLRMASYARLIAAGLGLSAAEQDLIRLAAPMHDVGKVGIPDHILLKAGRLTDEEMAIMRTHPAIGADILSNTTSPLLGAAASIALTHHEKYDGTGYPNGLKGNQIPLYGRIVAVADVFDALTSERPYKKAWDMDRARDFLEESAGVHFDPDCVAALLGQWEEVQVIHNRFQDEVHP